jgi:hypothetical protein
VSTRQKSDPLGVNNLWQPISGHDVYRGSPTDSAAYRYHGQRAAIYPQTMLFHVCLEWFWWAILYVGGSQVVRGGILGGVQG